MGDNVGLLVIGDLVGDTVGLCVGDAEGDSVVLFVGEVEGDVVGFCVGEVEGFLVFGVGLFIGDWVGSKVVED